MYIFFLFKKNEADLFINRRFKSLDNILTSVCKSMLIAKKAETNVLKDKPHFVSKCRCFRVLNLAEQKLVKLSTFGAV